MQANLKQGSRTTLAILCVSHVGLNLNKTEALLYVDHFCGGLCGRGEYVLMRKVNGVWHVVDSHVTWVSSKISLH